MALAIINPKKRRKAKKAAKSRVRIKRRRAANPVARVKRRKVRRTPKAAASRAGRALRRRRRNPIASGKLTAMLLPAATGAAGAAVVHKLLDMFGDKLPSAMQSGLGRYATEAAIALGIGYGLDKAKIVKPATRNALVCGALTVTAYNVLNNEVLAKIDGMGFAPAPATAVKGYEYGQLAGYQPGQLAGMSNAGVVVPMTATGSRQFS